MSTEHQSSSLALSAILLTLCIYFGAAQSTGGTVYFIVPASSSAGGSGPPVACPGEPCLTIRQFVFNRLFNSTFREGVTDIIMQLQPGYHNLSLPFTIDPIRNSAADSGVSSIVMNGTGPGDVTLSCTEDFSFNLLDSVRISGINLVNCGGPSTHIFIVTDFTLEDSTFQSDMPFRIERVVGNLIIVNSVFSNCMNGVLLIANGGRPMIRNCTFSDNENLRTASVPGSNAGAINFMSVNAFVDQCTFRNNRATFTGGAIYIALAGLAITNSDFFNNSVLTDGGAIYSINASLNIADSNFTNNFGQNDGGAVAINAERDTLTITRTEFTNNTAGREGGAVLVFHRNGSDPSFNFGTTISDSSFVGNSAARGGAVLNRGTNILFLATDTSFIDNTCSDDSFGSGAFYIDSSVAQVQVFRATFTRNQGIDGAMGVLGTNYAVTVGDSSFVENVATRSGGAIVSSSSNVGDILVSGSEFNRNSAPQCGALDLNAADMNPNIQTRGAQTVRITTSTFTNNTATVGSGGALCASDVSVSLLSVSVPVSTFTQNSAVTGGGAISTTNSDLTISAASFFDNTALSGGDTINACTSNVTVDLSAVNGQLNSVMDSECVVTTTTLSATTLSTTTFQAMTVFPTTTFVNGGVSSYHNIMINLMLFSFLTMILLVNY